MEPITWGVVLTAILAGVTELGKSAVGELGKSAIKDTYDKLKSLIGIKLGEDNKVITAIEEVEKEPTKESKKMALREELESTGEQLDNDVIQLANDLLEKIEAKPEKRQELINSVVTNYGDNSTIISGVSGRDFTISK